MTTPLLFTGTLSFPPDPGGANAPIAISFANQFNQIVAETLVIAGAGTKTLDLSALNGGAGATCLVVKVDSAAAGIPPVNLEFNAGTQKVEVSPGGFMVIGDPSPVAGITSLSIVTTGAATVRVWALGS